MGHRPIFPRPFPFCPVGGQHNWNIVLPLRAMCFCYKSPVIPQASLRVSALRPSNPPDFVSSGRHPGHISGGWFLRRFACSAVHVLWSRRCSGEQNPFANKKPRYAGAFRSYALWPDYGVNSICKRMNCSSSTSVEIRLVDALKSSSKEPVPTHSRSGLLAQPT